MSVLDKNIAVYKYFEEISKIPRGSYHEERISQYVVKFAIKHQLHYYQDDMYNVIVYKDASSGYEDHEPVMLQAHMDMVWEKEDDCNIDFMNDPIDLYEEDGWLKAHGTTLGADDGYGIAYMLAILEDDTLAHPPLDCVFTVQEEIGLCGVKNLKAENLRAHKMIGLDSGGEVSTCVSSSGGLRCKVNRPLIRKDNTYNTFKLSVSGLLGGHSGHFIDKERGNANKIAIRMLQHLTDEIDVYLVDVVGGAKENAIPRLCEITFACDTSIKYIDMIFHQIYKNIQVEYEHSDPNVIYHLEQVPQKASYSYDLQTSKEAINLLYLLPNGFKAKSMVIDNLTTISLNLGVIAINDDILQASYQIRSPMQSAKDELAYEIEMISKLFNATIIKESDYPGWNYEVHSPMRELYKQVIQKELHEELIEKASHGGLEIGVFKGLIPDLDIITLGPISYNAHTPKETMNIESFQKMYHVLITYLSQL
ncbi:MAG: beta-Ala-His dipeptidase [Erysipelotrichaceae bacterium]|nr:beta-Ala-His dipeptidase [Erysipelotrichaceae bacterium]